LILRLLSNHKTKESWLGSLKPLKMAMLTDRLKVQCTLELKVHRSMMVGVRVVDSDVLHPNSLSISPVGVCLVLSTLEGKIDDLHVITGDPTLKSRYQHPHGLGKSKVVLLDASMVFAPVSVHQSPEVPLHPKPFG
jgi:hypothetical protein